MKAQFKCIVYLGEVTLQLGIKTSVTAVGLSIPKNLKQVKQATKQQK